MRKIWIIMLKEIRDNLRDKRSLFFALVYGPLLLPALIVGPLIVNVNKYSQDDEKPAQIHVLGAERAGNLMAWLRSRNVEAEIAPQAFRQPLLDGDIDLVLEIAASYGDRFTAGEPARVVLHYNVEEADSERLFWRMRAELQRYSQSLAARRMAIRGLDQSLLQVLDILEVEVSEEEKRAATFANLVIFVVLISMTMGGFYLAIDSTAGERERLSLEPLLSLPVTRLQIAMGKYCAILSFVLLAFVLPMISLALWARFIPESFFGASEVPDVLTFARLLLLTAPICLLITGLLMALAAFSKSHKEAQTQVGFAMFVPMSPFFVIQFMDIKLESTTAAIPILSQYLLANKFVVDADYPLAAMVPGATSTVLLGLAFLATAVHLYRRDSILG